MHGNGGVAMLGKHLAEGGKNDRGRIPSAGNVLLGKEGTKRSGKGRVIPKRPRN